MRLRHWDRDYDERPDACPLCAMYSLPPGARMLAGWEDHAHYVKGFAPRHCPLTTRFYPRPVCARGGRGGASGLVVLLAWVLFLAAFPSPAWADHQEIYEPKFMPAAQADYLRPSDRVVGILGNGVAKAYPAALLFRHHIIHDRLGDLPIVATW